MERVDCQVVGGVAFQQDNLPTIAAVHNFKYGKIGEYNDVQTWPVLCANNLLDKPAVSVNADRSFREATIPVHVQQRQNADSDFFKLPGSTLRCDYVNEDEHTSRFVAPTVKKLSHDWPCVSKSAVLPSSIKPDPANVWGLARVSAACIGAVLGSGSVLPSASVFDEKLQGLKEECCSQGGISSCPGVLHHPRNKPARFPGSGMMMPRPEVAFQSIAPATGRSTNPLNLRSMELSPREAVLTTMVTVPQQVSNTSKSPLIENPSLYSRFSGQDGIVGQLPAWKQAAYPEKYGPGVVGPQSALLVKHGVSPPICVPAEQGVKLASSAALEEPKDSSKNSPSERGSRTDSERPYEVKASRPQNPPDVCCESTTKRCSQMSANPSEINKIKLDVLSFLKFVKLRWELYKWSPQTHLAFMMKTRHNLYALLQRVVYFIVQYKEPLAEYRSVLEEHIGYVERFIKNCIIYLPQEYVQRCLQQFSIRPISQLFSIEDFSECKENPSMLKPGASLQPATLPVPKPSLLRKAEPGFAERSVLRQKDPNVASSLPVTGSQPIKKPDINHFLETSRRKSSSALRSIELIASDPVPALGDRKTSTNPRCDLDKETGGCDRDSLVVLSPKIIASQRRHRSINNVLQRLSAAHGLDQGVKLSEDPNFVPLLEECSRVSASGTCAGKEAISWSSPVNDLSSEHDASFPACPQAFADQCNFETDLDESIVFVAPVFPEIDGFDTPLTDAPDIEIVPSLSKGDFPSMVVNPYTAVFGDKKLNKSTSGTVKSAKKSGLKRSRCRESLDVDWRSASRSKRRRMKASASRSKKAANSLVYKAGSECIAFLCSDSLGPVIDKSSDACLLAGSDVLECDPPLLSQSPTREMTSCSVVICNPRNIAKLIEKLLADEGKERPS